MKVIISKQKQNVFNIPLIDAMKAQKLVLSIIAVTYVIYNTFFIGFSYGVKSLLIFAVTYFASREVEIFFYRYYKKIPRKEAKIALKETHPEIVAILLFLILPVGTPLLVVLLATIFSMLIVRLAFGGFSHNVFNVPIAGLLFARAAYQSLVTDKMDSLYIDKVIINLFGDVDSSKIITFFDMNNKIGIYSSILIILGFLFLVYKKAIDFIVPMSIMVTMGVIILIIKITTGSSGAEINLYDAFIKNYTVFAILFLATDFATQPSSNKGKIIYGAIVGSLGIYIGVLKPELCGITESIMFGNMLAPMIADKTKDNKKMLIMIVSSLVIVGLIAWHISINFFK